MKLIAEQVVDVEYISEAKMVKKNISSREFSYKLNRKIETAEFIESQSLKKNWKDTLEKM
jgi:hypothetical protein